MIDLDLDYSSFEGLGKDHPSWKDRIALLDEEQAPLWHAMAAFQTAPTSWSPSSTAPPSACFRAVTREFPACHEAWANLGYALLMRYCDGLEVDDLRRFDLGQLAVGGFYRHPGRWRPRSAASTRSCGGTPSGLCARRCGSSPTRW